jgi:glycolate oxidase iron-sulfur subunit
MQTRLIRDILRSPEGSDAERILRSCVHCGFCNATCPTYQLLGDELDGPRGRIYLIKQMLEGQPVTRRTQLHLDRCLTCRNCETTCPSGVQYAALLEFGRNLVEQRVRRPLPERLLRKILAAVLPYRRRFAPLVRVGTWLAPLLPRSMRRSLPAGRRPTGAAPTTHARKVLLLDGCVQPSLAPEINRSAARVLDRLGIEVVRPRAAGCCGAVSLHLGTDSLAFMRRNIDAWWPHLEAGAEAVAFTASGCGVTIKDYGRLLCHDPAYAAKAEKVSSLAREIGEVIATETADNLTHLAGGARKIAFHAPCTLQHGLQLNGTVENLLRRLGFELSHVPDAHLCCGSAGTYSILQPELSKRLATAKTAALQSGAPELIATANIGCLLELRKRAEVPVVHWIELLAD